MDEEHYKEFAPNVIDRLEKLEEFNALREGFAPSVISRLEKLEAFAERVDTALFKDEPNKPALATVAYAVHNHIQVWCWYAARLGKLFRGAVRMLKLFAIAIASTSLIWAVLHHSPEEVARLLKWFVDL